MPVKRKAYWVEIDYGGCAGCKRGRTYIIVGPDEVALGRSWEDKDEAVYWADLLNSAFEKGFKHGSTT